MAWNEAYGEGIQPKQPDIFERVPPRFPGKLKRTNSCPDLYTDECKLADQQGYLLWDDLFKSMIPEFSTLPAQSTAEAVSFALEHMADLTLERQVSGKSTYKSRSASDVRRYSVANHEVIMDTQVNGFKKQEGAVKNSNVRIGKNKSGRIRVIEKIPECEISTKGERR